LLGASRMATANHSPLLSLIIDQLRTRRLTRRYRRWSQGRA